MSRPASKPARNRKTDDGASRVEGNKQPNNEAARASLDVPNLAMPPGKCVIEIRIVDAQGQETVADYKVAVADAPKPSD